MTSPSPYETAPAAFARRLAEIERLKGALDAKIARKQAEMAAEPTHWGHVGDLGFLIEQLKRAVGEAE